MHVRGSGPIFSTELDRICCFGSSIIPIRRTIFRRPRFFDWISKYDLDTLGTHSSVLVIADSESCVRYSLLRNSAYKPIRAGKWQNEYREPIVVLNRLQERFVVRSEIHLILRHVNEHLFKSTWLAELPVRMHVTENEVKCSDRTRYAPMRENPTISPQYLHLCTVQA